MIVTRIAFTVLALSLLLPLTTQAFEKPCDADDSGGDQWTKINGERRRAGPAFCMGVLLDTNGPGTFTAYSFQPSGNISGTYREGRAGRIVFSPNKVTTKRYRGKLEHWFREPFIFGRADIDEIDKIKFRKLIGKIWSYETEEGPDVEMLVLKGKVKVAGEVRGEHGNAVWSFKAQAPLVRYVAE